MRASMGGPVGKVALVGAFSVLSLADGSALAGTSTTTADQPDSWLVLYNLTDPNSVVWAQWFQQQRGIPSENMLGLSTSTDEHLADLATFETQIYNPVKQYLADNPQIEQRIMGIIAGFRIPGHYGTAPFGVGGKAVASALQDLNNLSSSGPELNPLFPPRSPSDPGPLLPPGGRLTKADLPAGHYMVTRLDAETLEMTKQLTLRARRIVRDGYFLPAHTIWYDYFDPDLGGLCQCWYWLQYATEVPDLADVPWIEFDSDTEQTPFDVIRFGTHDVTGWTDQRLRGTPEGPRVLSYNLNSWGATTVRSCVVGERYVPNSVDAGFAASIGATGEPGGLGTAPAPDKLLAGLREGWTLGESFYLANPYNDGMWILVGDPFLYIPNWFGALIPGDFDEDGDVDLVDFAEFAVCYDGADKPILPGCGGQDLDSDGDVDLDDFSILADNFTGSY